MSANFTSKTSGSGSDPSGGRAEPSVEEAAALDQMRDALHDPNVVNRLQHLLHDQLYAEDNADELAQRVLLNAHIGSLNFTVFR